jgi:hypothetical protein
MESGSESDDSNSENELLLVPPEDFVPKLLDEHEVNSLKL